MSYNLTQDNLNIFCDNQSKTAAAVSLTYGRAGLTVWFEADMRENEARLEIPLNYYSGSNLITLLGECCSEGLITAGEKEEIETAWELEQNRLSPIPSSAPVSAIATITLSLSWPHVHKHPHCRCPRCNNLPAIG